MGVAAAAVVAAMSVGVFAFVPAGASSHPPLIPVSNAFDTYFWSQDPDNYCQGRFALRGSCEIHTTDVNSVTPSFWAEPVPTGSGTEASSWIEIRIYDLDQNGALVFECSRTETRPAPDPHEIVHREALGAGRLCPWPNGSYQFAPRGVGLDANLRVEVDSNSSGWISLWLRKS